MPRTCARALAVTFLGLLVFPVACSSTDSTSTSSGGAAPDGGGGVEPAQADAAAPPPPGPDAAPPPVKCAQPADCASKICTAAGECAPASPTDGVQNGDETDVDCGGAQAPRCEAQKKCAAAGDCVSGVCKDVGAGMQCQPPSPTDGVKNGTETDVDCGGAQAPKCGDGLGCADRTDCTSDVCTAGKCAAAVCTDGVKNGSETDIDCGGPGCPRCADLATCAVADDCASNGCNYEGKCAHRRSCTGHYGGDTCGSGGEGGQGPAAWESCCATAPAGNGGVAMNKYQVTSGRVRAFLTRVNGNVRGFVQQARAANQLHGATLDAAWDLYLPTSMEGCEQLGNCPANELTDYEYGQTQANAYQGIWTSALRHVGGTVFNGQNLARQGCRIDAPGSHSYWMDAATQTKYFGDKAPDYGQSVYDTKPMNCVNYLIAQAFCVWDGGRLETQAEYTAMSGVANSSGAANGPVPWGGPLPFGPGSGTYFGFRFPTATDAGLRALNLPPTDPAYKYVPPAGKSIEWATYYYSYEYPNLGPNFDFIVFLSAPGRLRARSPNGHADFVGPMMEITSDVNNKTASPKTTYARWTANGSWEGHQWGYYGWNFSLVNKYGKQSLRCVYP